MMKFWIACVFAAVAATGCKKTPSCEEVFEHTKSLAPDEMKQLLEGQKENAIGKCEKMSDDAKKCAMDAKSMADLQKCR
ncbi:MAG: hypothetical protein ACTHU0_21330 [Kofleriaceae bacterium]